MKLLRVHIVSARSCGGLFDGFDVRLREASANTTNFEPLCLIGPNGAGKSQFIQVVAEIFQCLIHAVLPEEERSDGNPSLQFEVEYSISPTVEQAPIHVLARRVSGGRGKAVVVISRKHEDEWVECNLNDPRTATLLPTKVVGYTSGANETLSLPFLISRSFYADEVGRRARQSGTASDSVSDTRLMLVDYGTHLEVLVANLLLGTDEQRQALLHEAKVSDLHSFRCVIQLAHSAAPKTPPSRRSASGRKGIQLTTELEEYLDRLRRCSTSYQHIPEKDTYTFDFFVDDQTRLAFAHFWIRALELYGAFHKLAMLNDLAISKVTRERLKRETQERRFASRLPEPQDEEKVFRFERVAFDASSKGEVVDYVSLSDGEHQQAQLLGMMCMVSVPGVLFLLDEPESHFNPQWRVKLLSRILDVPTASGKRRRCPDGEGSKVCPAALQDCLLTTHSPFVPSDMPRERVLIFSKDSETGRIDVRRPDIETFGTTFDSILAECFDIRPPISNLPKAEINRLKISEDPDEIKQGMEGLGESIERIMLADRVRQLKRGSRG